MIVNVGGTDYTINVDLVVVETGVTRLPSGPTTLWRVLLLMELDPALHQALDSGKVQYQPAASVIPKWREIVRRALNPGGGKGTYTGAAWEQKLDDGEAIVSEFGFPQLDGESLVAFRNRVLADTSGDPELPSARDAVRTIIGNLHDAVQRNASRVGTVLSF